MSNISFSNQEYEISSGPFSPFYKHPNYFVACIFIPGDSPGSLFSMKK